MHQFYTYLMGLCLVGGICGQLSGAEPQLAPAEFGAVPTPRIVSKAGQSADQQLISLVDDAIEISKRRYLLANQNSPWQIYHGLNALRREMLLDVDGQYQSAIEWLSTTNPHFRGKPWFERTIHGGRAHRYTEPYYFEGHPNQSLALMVMCNLPVTHEFKVDEGTITVADIINNAKVDLNPQEELTWTLWFLTHYLTEDEVWKTRRGEAWSLEKLVEDQIKTDVSKAACGGTHNLYALSVARNNYERRGGQLRGTWLQADYKIKRYIVAARSLQRRDGSFPTAYFRGYGSPQNTNEQIASSGHMMEWLMVAVSERELNSEWIQRGIRYIATKLIESRDEELDCGPLYHTVAALMLYKERLSNKPWPNPEKQPETPIVVPPPQLAEIPAEAAAKPVPSMFPEGKTEAIPRTAMLDQPSSQVIKQEPTAAVVLPQPKESIVDQAAEGKLSIGLSEEELESEFELPTSSAPAEKEVEILASPEESTSTK